jgi:hypothetical protein
MTVTGGGGTIQGIRVVVSSAATTDGILLDASAVGADTDVAVTDVVRHAKLKLDDNPTAGSFQLVSLWQDNLQTMRVEHYFGAALLRSTGVAVTLAWPRRREALGNAD